MLVTLQVALLPLPRLADRDDTTDAAPAALAATCANEKRPHPLDSPARSCYCTYIRGAAPPRTRRNRKGTPVGGEGRGGGQRLSGQRRAPLPNWHRKMLT